jgi:protein-disulfide isomerase
MRKIALAFTGVTIAMVGAPASAQQDWSRTVVATAEGGMAMGNPNAKVRLVEYGSLTCSHCREFHEAGMKPLVANYVKTGKVRFEYRSYLLNGYDVAANLIARCNGPAGFFPISSAMFAAQPAWLAAAAAAPKDRLQSLQGQPPEKLLPQLASIAGLHKIGASNGVPTARANQCLANKASADKLIAFAEAARKNGVRGTPTFFLNDARVNGAHWPEVEAALKAALAR